MDRNIFVVESEDLLATITADTARTKKLYGQMIPNTKSGGCHEDLCAESEKKKVNPAEFSTGFTL